MFGILTKLPQLFSRRLLRIGVLLILTVFLPAAALAANQGTAGANSTGDFGISLAVPTLVRITKMADMSFGSYSGSGNKSLDHDICVWTNAPAGTYKVKAQGNGTNFAYTVAAGGRTIAYSVKWNNTSGPGNISLDVDTYSAAQSGANTQSQTCDLGNPVTANVQVTFTQAALLAAKPGTYAGTLTLIVSPP